MPRPFFLKGKLYAMDYKIYLRRVVALLLCCLLAVYTPVLPLAHASDPVTAATLAVTGGQIASGGLTGEAALAALGGPVGAVVGLTLGALGIGVYVSKASADAGVTPTEFVVTNIGKYCVLANIKKEQFYQTVIGGLSVAADGAIALSNSASKAIQQFGSWLVTQGSDTIVPEIPKAEAYVQFGDYKFTPFSNGSLPISGTYTSPYSGSVFSVDHFQFNSVSANASLLFLASGSQFVVLVPGNVSFPNNGYGRAFSGSSEVFSFNFGSSRHDLIHDKDGNIFTIALNSLPGFSASSSFSSVYSIDYSAFHSEIEGKTHSIVDSLPSTDVFTGTPDAWAENKDVLNPSADEDTPAAVLNPDVLNPIIDQLAEGTQWQMGIEDYLKALQAAFDKSITGLGDAVAQLTDVVTGIQKDIAIPDDAVKDVDITKPQVVPDDLTPVVEPLDVNPDEAIQGISFQLDEVFPFCLPFDVYKMLNLLSADPVAPRYHVHYEGPYNIVIDFTVDLSAWNDVAAICRNMELLLFCVGLAVVTRSIFIRA